MPTILSIQSQVAGARVGNSVAAFAMERLGVRVLQVPTVLLGRRPDHGAPGGGPVAAAQLAGILDGLEADWLFSEIDTVLSGYIGAAEHAQVIADAVARIKQANPKALYVCDPVLGDDGKLYVPERTAEAMLGGLAPVADWLIPNAYELSLIARQPVDDLDEARRAARTLEKPVLCTSIRTAVGIGNLYAAPTGDWFCETPRLPRAQKGAGDLLAGLFTARRVRGDAVVVALEAATGSVYDVIVRSLAAESEHLMLPQAQELLEQPVMWPQARPLERLNG